MKSRASLFPADGTSRRWYREPWPWLLISGPLTVVIASLASAWLAVRSDDGVVADDYYRRGLEINRKRPLAVVDPTRRPGATITVTAQGEVRARLEGLVDAPKELRLGLVHPGADKISESVALRRSGDGEYIGALVDPLPGRWFVTLESSAWRLPTTVTQGLSEIRLGAAEQHRSSEADGSN